MAKPAHGDGADPAPSEGFQTVSRLRLVNHPSALGRMEDWLNALAATLPLDADGRYRLDLILNEAANNIIDYAWEDGAEHYFHVTAAHRDGEVKATLEDDGRPFNPLDYPEPRRVERLEDAPVGGLGIHLMRTQCDAWYYRRVDDRNRLTLVVHRRGDGVGRRRGPDRRRVGVAVFPLHLSGGEVIAQDRRGAGDRRANSYISDQQLCTDIPYETVEPVLAGCVRRKLAPGEILLAPGEQNENLFLVLNGRLQVHLDAADSRLGFPIEPGECAGEMSIIDGKPVSAYVVADEASEVLPVHKDIFWNQLAQTPGITRNLMQLLAERMRRRNDVMLNALEQELRLEHLERELATARQIQAGMLPKQSPLFPGHPEVDVHAVMEPAREVGGDFFDAFPIDAERVCIAIGDVSDKGIPAALFMVRTMTLIRTAMLATGSVDTLLPGINRQLAAGNDSAMFVTVFVGVLNVVTGNLRYVNGGHPPPLLERRHGPPEPIPLPRGILVGVTEAARFEVAELTLGPGDRLTVYTDGVTEAENPDLEQLTEPRLRGILAGLGAERAAERVGALRNAVRAFAAGAAQSDDITVLMLRYLGHRKT